MIPCTTKLTTGFRAESNEAYMPETRLVIEVPPVPMEMGWRCPRCGHPRQGCTCG